MAGRHCTVPEVMRDTTGDAWARRISREYSELVRTENQNYPGLNFIPG